MAIQLLWIQMLLPAETIRVQDPKSFFWQGWEAAPVWM
jgi:hypothetical protein